MTGLSEGKVEAIDVPEGGSNVVRKIAGGVVKFDTLVLERNVDGSPFDKFFREWFKEMFQLHGPSSGSSKRRNGAILKLENGREVLRFAFYEAWVKMSKFSDLEADSNNLFKQTIEIEHNAEFTMREKRPDEVEFVNGVVRRSYEYLKEHGVLCSNVECGQLHLRSPNFKGERSYCPGCIDAYKARCAERDAKRAEAAAKAAQPVAKPSPLGPKTAEGKAAKKAANERRKKQQEDRIAMLPMLPAVGKRGETPLNAHGSKKKGKK